MQDGAPRDRADEIRAWLRKHCADDPELKITTAWRAAQPNDAVYHRILEIMFGPPPDNRAA